MDKKIIGYTCGTFDLFHIGHLNILRKAKSQCDYLIVGINSDETVQKVKNKTPIIGFNERREIIESIKYVDEVIKVDIDSPFSKGSDWQTRIECDVLFSGDDHINDPDWKELKALKEKNGTKIVFFSYTKSTSSTIIRNILESYDQ